jgi:hypothetical protein
MVILIKINLKKLNKKNKYFSQIYIKKELKFKWQFLEKKKNKRTQKKIYLF